MCTVYKLNRSPTSANQGVTPAIIWYRKNNLTKLRVFGSQAWYVILPKLSKLEKRTKNCILVGNSQNGYRLSDYENNKIVTSRDVVFDENQSEMKMKSQRFKSYQRLMKQKRTVKK